MSNRISTEWTPGDFPMAKADWQLCQADLQTAEDVLRNLSSGTSWEVIGNIRVDWPARRLRRRRGFRVEEIRVLLAEDFDTPDKRRYVVTRSAVSGFALWRRDREYVVGAHLNAAEISNPELVRESVRRLIDGQ